MFNRRRRRLCSALLLCFSLLVIGRGNAIAGELSYLDELRTGACVRVSDSSLHSDISVPVVRYQEEDWLDTSLSLGVLDYQELTLTGEDWFYDLQLSISLEADILKLSQKVPVLEYLASALPEWIYMGVGQVVHYVESEEVEGDWELENYWIVKASVTLSL